MKITTLFKSFAVIALALLVMATPYGAFAHNDKVNGKAKADAEVSVRADKNNDDGDNGSRRSCTLRAFGHLIASGWLKKNNSGANGGANADISSDCPLPFGIAKKLNNDGGNNGDDDDEDEDNDGDDGDEDEDTGGPVISNLQQAVNSSSAVIRFSTDEKASATVFYGTSANLDLNSSSTLRVSKNRMNKDHQIRLASLSADTTYYVVVQVKDDDGNMTTSAEFSF